MRQMRSSGSVKAISVNVAEVISRLRQVAEEALAVFPEVQEVRLIGSIASGTHTGTSDVDVFLRVRELTGNPVECMRPYFFFFSRRLDVGLDLLISGPEVPPAMKKALQGSVLLAARGVATGTDR
ncbi:MAG: nucleotidyltransferase domain-containing protein [Calditrichaeota bacterium]|nr:nucleotidyltransferase domain-containing protein [Calditrichota bacterium]